MSYDLLIKNGRVIDGTGSPAFKADVGIRNGKIAAIGNLSGIPRGAAKRTIDAQGQVVAPGFLDSHTHYDAQVMWDPLCTWSCYHGVTTVVTGNCSLALAPVRPGTGSRVLEFLSYVEAIPMETLSTIDVSWETFGQYLDTIDGHLGMNVAALAGHTPIRHYVMGSDSQGRDPTPAEVEQMKGLVREAIEAGAIGLSFTFNNGHFDPQGNRIPSAWAREDEVFALAGVLGEMGAGVLQAASGINAEVKNGIVSRLCEKTGRPFIFNQLAASTRNPEGWKKHIQVVDGMAQNGLRANPLCSPQIMSDYFDMHNCQVFGEVASWKEVLISGDDARKLKAYQDPDFRKKVHEETLVNLDVEKTKLGKNWPNDTIIQKTRLAKNKQYEDKSLREYAKAVGKGEIDAFLDLVVEENLDTEFLIHRRGHDPEVMGKILNYPNALIGLSDAGAHVQFHGGYGISSTLLGHWVRKEKIMTVEAAVKKMSFDLAQAFGIYDRGLLQPGMAADIVVFDPDTIRTMPEERVTDLPAGAWRIKELAEGVMCTIVNGQVLIENGKPTGALPGRVIRNSLYRQRQEDQAMAQGMAAAR